MCEICETLFTLALTGYKNLASLKLVVGRITLQVKPINGPASSYELRIPSFLILAYKANKILLL